MTRRWDDDSDDAVVDTAIRVLVVTYAIEQSLAGLRRMATGLLKSRRDARGETASLVQGMPCAAEVEWNAKPEVATHDVAPPDDGFSMHEEPPSRPAA